MKLIFKFALLLISGMATNSIAQVNQTKDVQRRPSARQFSGDVEINVQKIDVSSGSYYDMTQIIDRTNKVICYGRVDGQGSSISCLPLPQLRGQ